ncbi:PRA1 family protein G2-like [Euphorbia lathyris]|uniref:PRA1 family protein G2-like n=1 Tax=Euphorbia lathyris TaxID=212925 RepID=UPI003313AEC9
MVQSVKLTAMTYPPVSAAASSATTYTTIPISAADVLSRSLYNLTATFSLLRPWPELIASAAFDRPDSFSSALSRLHFNFRYFLINYLIIVSAFGALSLIGSPFALLLFAFVFALWLLLYFFREDPLVLRGYQVNDRLIILGLVVASILTIWITGALWTLVLGVSIGIFICGVHGVLRNSDGLSVDEQDAESTTLIGSISGPRYGAIPVSDRNVFTS